MSQNNAYHIFLGAGVLMGLTVLALHSAGSDNSKERAAVQQELAAAPAPAHKLTNKEKEDREMAAEVERAMADGRKGKAMMADAQRMTYSGHLEDFLVSAGITHIEDGDRYRMIDNMRKGLKQTGYDCDSSPYEVAHNVARKFPGSDESALASWIYQICIFDTTYGNH